MSRWVCVHGHFYQPPRESPWLERVEVQDSAHPHHDWNERISAECYGPNGAARILDEDGAIRAIVNNYARMSFNFGPTLLAWLERERPRIYATVLAADREGRLRFGGHGPAMAQAYGHMILPLANARDRRTQIVWGVRDFELRFGRKPEGMWLPETAVDTATLEDLAVAGVRFTILAPHQARRVRLEGGRWRDLGHEAIDTTRGYRVALPSGRELYAFFYDGVLGRAVAFDGLLRDGAALARDLVAAVPVDDQPRLSHIATDGETYGHHHRFGDMALASALDRVGRGGQARLTVYGEFLEVNPPEDEVEVRDGTSWSCAHGIERWRSDCGCATGDVPGARQGYRRPLRAAFDWLRDTIAGPWEFVSGSLFPDPWAVRDAYIDVVLDRSRSDDFLLLHAGRGLEGDDRVRALELLELQRHAMLMYTSCAWFFDDVSRLEPLQVLRYAARVVQLAESTLGLDLTKELVSRLSEASSALPEYGDAGRIYRERVQPLVVDLEKVAVHYAVSLPFLAREEECHVPGFTVVGAELEWVSSGRARLAVGRARFTSEVTGDSAAFAIAAVHLGEHHVSAGVRWVGDDDTYRKIKEEGRAAMASGDLPQAFRWLDQSFGAASHGLKSLFVDAQRRILAVIHATRHAEAEAMLSDLYHRQSAWMRYLTEVGMPLPAALRAAAEITFTGRLRELLAREPLPLLEIDALRVEAAAVGVVLLLPELRYALQAAVDRLASRVETLGHEVAAVAELRDVVLWLAASGADVDLWSAQNAYHLLHGAHGANLDPAWRSAFRALGEGLGMRLRES